MELKVYKNKKELAAAASEKAAEALKAALDKKAVVRLIAATGNAQLDFLAALRGRKDIDWTRVELFHLDEYVGLAESHPASFVGYIRREIAGPLPLKKAHFINGTAVDPEEERRRLSRLIAEQPVDVAFVGIGENGHLAFNDPPADFETEEPYLIVNLDEKCRNQQVGEGWFPSLDAVPRKAFSMAIKQIMKTGTILCIVPEKRKAEAVRDCLGKDKDVTPLHPASILKRHPNVYIYLDEDSASLLPKP
jgi:glucosamine-6-phosphate deaminase